MAGLQSCVVQECQRTCEHPWLLSEPNYSVEISDNVKGTLKQAYAVEKQ